MEERDEPVAFTYAIHWTEYNKSYYGVRYAKGCKTTDIWTKYFTSSKKVKEFRAQYGEPDLIIIDQMFTDIEEARDYEEWILHNNSCMSDDSYLNLHDSRSPPIVRRFNQIVTEETRKKMSDAKIGKSSPKKGKPSGVIPWNKGTKGLIESWNKGKKIDSISGDNHYSRQKGFVHPRAGENHHFAGKKRPDMSGENHPNYDPTMYIFEHPVVGVITSTKSNFSKDYNLQPANVRRIISGKAKSTGGWICNGIYTE